MEATNEKSPEWGAQSFQKQTGKTTEESVSQRAHYVNGQGEANGTDTTGSDKQSPHTHAGTPAHDIAAGIQLLVPAGHVTELRVLNTAQQTVSGYFDDPDKLAHAALEWDTRGSGVYFMPNRVHSALLARAQNRMVLRAKQTTSDKDIERRRFLMLNFDADRPAGISATNTECDAAIARMWDCVGWLRTLEFTDLLAAVSGNGGHVLAPIDLPNDSESLTLVKRCVAAIGLRFADNVIVVDQTVTNAARIWKLYGTTACKGDSTPDRPHRKARILEAPDQFRPNSKALLEHLATLAPEAPKRPPPRYSQRAGTFNLEEWISTHNLDPRGPYPWQEGKKWIFTVCPFNQDHTNSAAYIVQFGNGAIAAGCHHNGCVGNDWHALRKLYEPGYTEWGKQDDHGTGQTSHSHGADFVDKARKEDRGTTSKTALCDELRAIILDPDVKSFDKKRGVADAIRQHFIKNGAFYRTSDSRLFFFSTKERRLYDLEQRQFSHLLIEESGLSTTETFFNFAFDTLVAHVARQGTPVEVHTLAHYDPQTHLLSISDGGGGMWRRERNGRWEEAKNGDDNILFLTESETIPWSPSFDSQGNLPWLLEQINFFSTPLSVEDQRTFFFVWLLHQFFPTLRRTRTIPAWLGPQGSGKSTACRLIGRFLLGESFDVSGLRKEKEDAFVAAITNRVLYALDNADTRIDWLEDALARYATGEVFRLRRLYTTNDEVSYRARAILMLTSRDPHFQRADVSQRLLPFHLQQIEQFQDEPSIFAELHKRRNALWGELLTELAEAQDAMNPAAVPKFSFRMADYAAFGWQVFSVQKKEREWIEALQRLDAAQMRFAAEGDGMVMALGILMDGAEQLGPFGVRELYAKVADVADANSLAIPKTTEWFGRKLTSQKRVIESELNVTLLDERGHERKRTITIKKKKV